MLADYLVTNVWYFVFIASRILTVFINMPGIGSNFIPVNVRLIMGVSVVFITIPLVTPLIPPLPSKLGSVVFLIFNEILVGLIIGLSIRVLVNATHIAGQIASMHSGLGIAVMLDPNHGQQGSIIGGLLSIITTALILVTDMHHMMLFGIRDSYMTFIPGEGVLMGDALKLHTDILSDAFLLGFQIATPFICVSVVMYTAMGILSRLMPQIQIFFVIQPVQVLISLFILAATIPSTLTWLITNLERLIRELLMTIN